MNNCHDFPPAICFHSVMLVGNLMKVVPDSYANDVEPRRMTSLAAKERMNCNFTL